MSIAQYKWDAELKDSEKIRICISDKLNVLLGHSQEEVELMYFYKTDGCRYICSGEELQFSGGELAVVNSGEFHACNCWGKGCIAACVILNIKKIQIRSFDNLRFKNKISENGEIKDIFDRLYELLTDQKMSVIEKECFVNSLVYRLLGELAKTTEKTVTKSEKLSKIEEVISYIDENFLTKISVDTLAQIMHLSTDRFFHVFKETVGMSPLKYITEKRISKACELLKTSDLSIAEIAQECNFCTSSYFCKKFLLNMKMTPNQYRKQKELDDLLS